jgi:uncharacterized protein (DUF1800 family)
MNYALVLLSLLSPNFTTSSLHDMGIDAKVTGKEVQIEVFFEDSAPATEADVEVLDNSRAVVAKGKTDASGKWQSAALPDGDYQIVVEDGAGHSTWENVTVGEPPTESSKSAGEQVDMSDTTISTIGSENANQEHGLWWIAGLLSVAVTLIVGFWYRLRHSAVSESKNVLFIACVAGAWLLSNAEGTAQEQPESRSTSADPSVVWDENAARHLLSRTCFGGTPEQARALATLSIDDAVKSLLDDAENAQGPSQPEWVRDVWVNSLRRYSDMPREEYLVMFRRASSRNDVELLDLKSRWVQHMVQTPHPLRENLTLFWHGHFTSASGKMFAVTQAFYQQNETWRRHSLGNFRAFLEAVTLDPGMLIYLDMEGSTKENPNENYARELLELFSLGVEKYSEGDIREVARSLTGWTLDAPAGSVKPDRPTNPETAKSLARDGLIPTFVADQHDDGTKTVFGHSGRFGVQEVLDLIVEHPACGPHVAACLLRYFGVEDPAGELKQRMATAFRESHFEIRPMLHVLLTSPEFYSGSLRGNRVKSPVRLLVGACRDLKLDGEFTPSIAQATVPLGQELFNPPTVKGWPTNTDWITSTTLALRYRLPEVLLDGKNLSSVRPLGRIRGTLIPRDAAEGQKLITRLLALDEEKRDATTQPAVPLKFAAETFVEVPVTADAEKLTDELLKRLLVVPARTVTRDAIISEIRGLPPKDRTLAAVRLILATPEYQME